jgi:hypothetical protein
MPVGTAQDGADRTPVVQLDDIHKSLACSKFSKVYR